MYKLVNWASHVFVLSKLRKLLGEEKRSCHSEGDKLKEVHQLFEQVNVLPFRSVYIVVYFYFGVLVFLIFLF